MKQNFIISELSLEVRFTGKTVQCYDLITKQPVNKKSFRYRIVNIQQKSYNSFQIRDTIGDRYNVYIDLAEEKSRIGTNAQYIRELIMDSQNHGYYLGTYEIGEFFLSNSKNLKKIRSYPLEYCSKGCITPSKKLYFGLRESETINGPHLYFLAKVDWNLPILEWKKPLSSPVMAISLVENRLFIGLKEGKLQIWDAMSDTFEKEFRFNGSPIQTVEKGIDKIIITNWDGTVIALTTMGEILWKSKISNGKITGILEGSQGIRVVDEQGNFFQLNSKTGEIVDRTVWNFRSQRGASLSSNLVLFRDWFIATGGAGIWAHWSKNHSISYHQYIEDPLMRTLQPHPQGVFTGDDDGYIRFWQVGGIRASKIY